MILMPITSIRWLPLVAGMGAVIGGMCRSARADEALYTNDFNGPAGSTYREWSSSPIRYFNTVTPKDGSSLDAPAVTNSDSPNREQCSVFENRTNSPLQALELMNDVTFLEAARKLAERMMTEGGAKLDDVLQEVFGAGIRRQDFLYSAGAWAARYGATR